MGPMPVTAPELVAATLGTFPRLGVGLLMTTPAGVWAKDDCVVMDEAELVLVGLIGRIDVTGGGARGVPVDEGNLTSDGIVEPVGVDSWVICAEPDVFAAEV